MTAALRIRLIEERYNSAQKVRSVGAYANAHAFAPKPSTFVRRERPARAINELPKNAH
jgi:hypothetical protein